MKALTIRQPWATLIITGVKDVENRSWPVPGTLWRQRRAAWPNDRGTATTDYVSPFPFTVAIHAATSVTGRQGERIEYPGGWETERAGHTYLLRNPSRLGWWPYALPLGAILGTVTVTGCHGAWECTEPDRVPFYPEDPDWRLETCSPWGELYPDDRGRDVYHWTLKHPQRFPEPIPAKGRQKLWEWDDTDAKVAL